MNYQNTNKIKCDFILFFIFNGLSATKNGNTSMCCGNSELIRVSFVYSLNISAVNTKSRPSTASELCTTVLVVALPRPSDVGTQS